MVGYDFTDEIHTTDGLHDAFVDTDFDFDTQLKFYYKEAT